MLPRHEPPSPVSRAIVQPSLLRAIALCVATVVMATIAVGLYRWAMEPIAPSGTSASIAAANPSGVASPVVMPPEIIQMAAAVSTSLAPTPTQPEPSPTYAMLPTPRPLAVCLTSTPRGELCTQPKPPAPTATPVLPCPVTPGEVCINQGGAVLWLSPTPTWAPGPSN